MGGNSCCMGSLSEGEYLGRGHPGCGNLHGIWPENPQATETTGQTSSPGRSSAQCRMREQALPADADARGGTGRGRRRHSLPSAECAWPRRRCLRPSRRAPPSGGHGATAQSRGCGGARSAEAWLAAAERGPAADGGSGGGSRSLPGCSVSAGAGRAPGGYDAGTCAAGPPRGVARGGRLRGRGPGWRRGAARVGACGAEGWARACARGGSGGGGSGQRRPARALRSGAER